MQSSENNGKYLKSVYCDDKIIQMCKEIETGYDRPLRHVGNLVIDDAYISQLGPNVEEVRGFLTELRGGDAFKWYMKKNGNSTKYLPEMAINTCNKIFTPRYRGNCFYIDDLLNGFHPYECDSIISVNDTWFLYEVTSTNGFSKKRAQEKIDILEEEMGTHFGFVLGVPNDNSKNKQTCRAHFEVGGSRVLPLPDTFEELTLMAEKIVHKLKK